MAWIYELQISKKVLYCLNAFTFVRLACQKFVEAKNIIARIQNIISTPDNENITVQLTHAFLKDKESVISEIFCRHWKPPLM